MHNAPDPVVKLTDDRNWLSLHWAVSFGSKVSEKEFTQLYISNPFGPSRFSLKGGSFDWIFQGLTL